MQYQDDLLPSDFPTPKQIAERLKLLLIQYDEGNPIAISIDYDRFYSIAERDRIAKSLYTRVEFEGIAIGIIVGFGSNRVIVVEDVQDDVGGQTIFMG